MSTSQFDNVMGEIDEFEQRNARIDGAKYDEIDKIGKEIQEIIVKFKDGDSNVLGVLLEMIKDLVKKLEPIEKEGGDESKIDQYIRLKESFIEPFISALDQDFKKDLNKNFVSIRDISNEGEDYIIRLQGLDPLNMAHRHKEALKSAFMNRIISQKQYLQLADEFKKSLFPNVLEYIEARKRLVNGASEFTKDEITDKLNRTFALPQEID